MLAATAVGAALIVSACGGASSSTGSSGSGSTASKARSSAGAGAPSPSSTAQEISPSGDIPDNQAYVTYQPKAGGYSVRVPEGWARTGSGSSIVFTGKLNSIRVQARSLSSAPNVASVRAQELATVRSATHGYAAGSVSMVQRHAGAVVRATFQVDSAPNAVTGKSVRDAVERYSYWKGGQEVVLTLSGPTGADNVDPWRIVTDSFRWTR